jgi:threonine/homoserine/homoserine lactone efflux protein
MSEMEFLLKGIVAGFIVAVPIGPVAVLCFRRVLTERALVGLATVLGAAAADAIYGLVAVFGVSAVTHLLAVHHDSLRMVGGVLIAIMGIAMFRTKPQGEGGGSGSAANLAGLFLSTMLLMLANPSIIVSFAAVFAALGVGEGPTVFSACWVAAGILAGSSAWWLVYRIFAVCFGHRVSEGTLRAIDRTAGSLICAFGTWQFVAGLLARFSAHGS